MGTLQWTLKFYVAERHESPLVLVPGHGGMPEVATPTHPLLRVSYLSPESAASAQGIASAKSGLHGPYPLLLLTMPCPDGPPFRCGVVFRRNQTVTVNWTDGRHGRASVSAEEYLAAVSLHGYSWGSDLMRNQPGYFLSGSPEASALWKIARVEFDLASRKADLHAIALKASQWSARRRLLQCGE